jgi:hypothetical protein
MTSGGKVGARSAGRSAPPGRRAPSLVDSPLYDSAVQAGHASKAVDVTITNPGALVASVDVQVQDATAFKIVNQNCTDVPLAGGYQCVVTLRFEPPEERDWQTKLVVRSTDVDVPPPLELSGTGTAPGAITFDPVAPELDITWTSTGNPQAPTSLSKQVTVKNTGGGQIKIKTISLDSTAHFTVSHDCDGRILDANGGHCSVTLTFNQSGTGRADATMIVTDDVGGQTRLSVSGYRGYRLPILVPVFPIKSLAPAR